MINFSGITQRTSRHKSPKPSSEEIHPQVHRPSTATPYDEARWLQFFKGSPKTGPKTEPYKPSALNDFPKSPTPSRVVATAALSSPAYPFNFGEVSISPTARRELEDTRLEASNILKQMREQKAQLEADQATARKIAKPKGRFSNAHTSAFSKMDSIANHASAWRANPSRAQPSLKRVASKPELGLPTAPRALKRSPSKAELDTPETPRQLKRSPSKTSLVDASGGGSPAAQEPSAKRVKRDIKPPGTYALSTVGTPAAASKPATPRTLPAKQQPAVGGARRAPSSALGRRSNLLSPTAASLARSRSTHDLRGAGSGAGAGGSRIPTTLPPPRAPSAIDLLSAVTLTPTRHAALAARTSPLAPYGRSTPIITRPVPMPSLLGHVGSGTTATTSSLGMYPSLPAPKASVVAPTPSTPSGQRSPPKAPPKSILRSPTRLYSTDPSKIAAGTHLATPTPPRASAASRLPVAVTEPASERGGGKHVDFSASARLKALRDEAKAAATTVVQAPYPDLSARADEAVAEAARVGRGDFTFRADGGQPIVFAGASTIRAVRDDDDGGNAAAVPSPLVAGVKRKAGAGFADRGGEGEDKENDGAGDDSDGERPAKKMRRGTVGPSLAGGVSPVKKRTLGATGGGGKRAAAQAAGRRILTTARLNYLARPKRSA
jgi:hypothetical protein